MGPVAGAVHNVSMRLSTGRILTIMNLSKLSRWWKVSARFSVAMTEILCGNPCSIASLVILCDCNVSLCGESPCSVSDVPTVSVTGATRNLSCGN